jgi:hypothetical protein
MNDLKHTVDKIYKKAQKLLEQKLQLEESVTKLQSEQGNLKLMLKEKDKLISTLNEELKTVKLAKQLSGHHTDNGFSEKINEMIRELDGVIGKLKTEKD